MNSLGEHGQDVGDGLHGHRRSLAALHGPHPALVKEVTRQGGQGGRSCPVGCHAERRGTVGRLQKVLHVENEGGPEVQRQLLIPVKYQPLISITVSCQAAFVHTHLMSSFSRGLLSTTTQGLSDRAGLGAMMEGVLDGDGWPITFLFVLGVASLF